MTVTSLTAPQDTPPPTVATPCRPTHWWSRPLLGLILSLTWLAFCSLLWTYPAFRETHPQVRRGDLAFFAWGWGAAQGAMLLLCCFVAWAVPSRMRRGGGDAAMLLCATTVLAGLVVIGLRGVEWARWGGPRMFNVPTAPTTPTLASTPARARTAPATDPGAGAGVFARTCASCHGSKGQGVAGVAPALMPSDFVRQSSASQLAAVITLGRQPNDPASRTGKMMPARGGNPFLSDADIADIVAFLHLDSDPGETNADKTDAGKVEEPPAAADVPRWVLPPPPAGPAGLSPAFAPRPPTEPLPAQVRQLQPSVSERAMAPMAAVLSGTHGLLVLVGIGLMAAAMGHAYLNPTDTRAQGLARFTRLYWLGLVLTWAMIFPLLYLV